MKKITLPLLFLLCFLTAGATINLSSDATVSLLTCEPGEAVYARFGHTGIRIQDPATELDVVYHYGIFDFDTDWFLAKFVSGATDYELGKLSMASFMREYTTRQSTVHEQVLNMTPQELQTLYNALEVNYLPENRLYRYNYIYDNCATRPFSIIFQTLETTPIFTYSHPTTSFRRIIGNYVGENTWLRFGIDILIGREADIPITTESLIGFPKYTMALIGSAIMETDTTSTQLVESTEQLCTYPAIKNNENSTFSPVNCTILFLLIITLISYVCRRKGIYLIGIDVLLFALFGLLGCIVFFLTFFSLHPLVGTNLNLLWLNPIQLIFAFAILKKNWRGALSYIALLNLIAALVAIIICVTRVQVMNPAFLPLMAVIVIRSYLFFLQFNPRRNNASNSVSK